MDKIRKIDSYVSTIRQNSDFFKSYYFHSLIDLNLVKLDSILKNGILSKSQIEQKKLINLYTHDAEDFDSKNGENYISLTEYSDKCHFNILFESFPLHTMTSISIMTDKRIEPSTHGERESYFDDEVFYPHSIPKTHLEGIILPEYLTNLKISKTNCLPNDISCYTRSYIKNLICCLENYFDRKIPTYQLKKLEASLIKLWNLLDSFERPERMLQRAIELQREDRGEDIKDVIAQIQEKLWEDRLQISEPTNLDVIRTLNDDNLPIYEIKTKKLQRLN